MFKSERNDLTQGNILGKIIALAVPIMGSQFMQTVYNLTDVFWLGRLGSEAVAASGIVGQFMWMAVALLYFGGKGAEIGVSQNIGRKNYAAARDYAQSSLTIALVLGALYGLVLFLFRHPLVGFFNIQEAGVVQSAVTYLSIVALGMPFYYVSNAVVGVFNGSGNSKTPFYVNLIAMLTNVVLDPLLIFTAGWGIAGAAIATVAAQILGCVLMVTALMRSRQGPFEGLRLFAAPKAAHVRQIFKWAAPLAVESAFFTFLIMMMTRFVALFGAAAMAVQQIGSQVESLSWLVANGFSSAFGAFAGQNCGARRWGRLRKGFSLSSVCMVGWGLFTTVGMVLSSGLVARVFIPDDPSVAALGASYLKLLALCQLFGCLENVASGAYRGLGKTLIPAVISISVNLMRLLAVWQLSQSSFGLRGVWWGTILGACLRGLLIHLSYWIYSARLPKTDEAPASLNGTF